MSAVRTSASGAADAAFGRRDQAGHAGQDAGGRRRLPHRRRRAPARRRRPAAPSRLRLGGRAGAHRPGSTTREHVAARLLGVLERLRASGRCPHPSGPARRRPRTAGRGSRSRDRACTSRSPAAGPPSRGPSSRRVARHPGRQQVLARRLGLLHRLEIRPSPGFAPLGWASPALVGARNSPVLGPCRPRLRSRSGHRRRAPSCTPRSRRSPPPGRPIRSGAAEAPSDGLGVARLTTPLEAGPALQAATNAASTRNAVRASSADARRRRPDAGVMDETSLEGGATAPPVSSVVAATGQSRLKRAFRNL